MKAFVIDVDGCLTDGMMWYTKGGKVMKAFGADDHDALKLIKDDIEIHFVTADAIGFPISYKRIAQDMNASIHLVSMEERFVWIGEKFNPKEVIYMGDGILDPFIFHKVGYSICPADGFFMAKETADYVCFHSGGHRAVAEACMHIKEKFLV